MFEDDKFIGITRINDDDTGLGGTVKNGAVQTGNTIGVCGIEIMSRLMREQGCLPCQEQGYQ